MTWNLRFLFKLALVNWTSPVLICLNNKIKSAGSSNLMETWSKLVSQHAIVLISIRTTKSLACSVKIFSKSGSFLSSFVIFLVYTPWTFHWKLGHSYIANQIASLPNSQRIVTTTWPEHVSTWPTIYTPINQTNACLSLWHTPLGCMWV